MIEEILLLVNLRAPMPTTTETFGITDICPAAIGLLGQHRVALPYIETALNRKDLTPWSRLILNTIRSKIDPKPGDAPEIKIDAMYDLGPFDPVIESELSPWERLRRETKRKLAADAATKQNRILQPKAVAVSTPLAAAAKSIPHQNADDQSSLGWMWIGVVLLLVAAVGGILLFKNRSSA
jgi:hypothetical protein